MSSFHTDGDDEQGDMGVEKTVITYKQTKIGLTSIYMKRKLCRDDVSTTLLDL